MRRATFRQSDEDLVTEAVPETLAGTALVRGVSIKSLTDLFLMGVAASGTVVSGSSLLTSFDPRTAGPLSSLTPLQLELASSTLTSSTIQCQPVVHDLPH